MVFVPDGFGDAPCEDGRARAEARHDGKHSLTAVYF